MKLHEYFDKVTLKEVLESMEALDASSRFTNDEDYTHYTSDVIQAYNYLKLASRVEELRESKYTINVLLLSIDAGKNDVAFMIISETPIEKIIDDYIINKDNNDHTILDEAQKLVLSLPVTEWLFCEVDSIGLHVTSLEDKQHLNDKGVLAIVLMEIVNNKKVQ